jgi:hypothetical protein
VTGTPHLHSASRVGDLPAVWAVAVLLALGQFTFLLALQPLAGIGIWFQSEPVSAANAGIAGLILAILGLRRTALRLPPLAVLVLLTIVAWSLITLPFALSPIGSWLGTPQSGHGIGWLLTIAAYALGANALRHHRAPMGLAVVAMAAGAFGLTALNNWAPIHWRPQHFTDIAAFNALFAWMAIMAWKPGRPAVTVSAGLGLAGLILLSDNRSAYMAVFAGAIAMVLAGWAGRKSFGRSAMALLPGLAVFSLTAVILVFGRYDLMRNVQHGLRDTVISRANMIRVVGEEIKTSPMSLLFGQGWGGFDIALSRSMVLDQVALQPMAGDDFLFWDAAHRNDFHTHNEVVEATLSAGLPAGLAMIVLLCALVHGAPRRFRVSAAGFSVALAILSCMWFQLPTSIPAFGAVIGLMGVGGRRKDFVRIARPAYGAGCALLLATSAALWIRADAGRQVFAGPLSGECAPLLAGQARIHSVWLIQAQRLHLTEMLQNGGGPDLAAEVERMRRYLCSADAMASARDGVPLAVEAVIIRSHLAHHAWPEGTAAFRDVFVRSQKEGLMRTLMQAPKRSDLAAPYLSSLIAAGQEAEALDFARRALPANDPVGLWFSGIVMLGSPEKFSTGMRMMKQSLRLGVERFVEIPPEVKSQINGFAQ